MFYKKNIVTKFAFFVLKVCFLYIYYFYLFFVYAKSRDFCVLVFEFFQASFIFLKQFVFNNCINSSTLPILIEIGEAGANVIELFFLLRCSLPPLTGWECVDVCCAMMFQILGWAVRVSAGARG